MGKKTTLEKNLTYSLELKQSSGSPFVERLLELAAAEKQGSKTKTEFWKKGDFIPAADGIILRAVQPFDREPYLVLQEHYCLMKSMIKEESFREMLWEEHNEDRALMMTVIKGNEYIGYCGIKDTTKDSWEIVIELMPEWTGMGIGTATMTAMLNELGKRLNVTSFAVKIDPDNTASQKLFERLGAVPDGLDTIFIHKEEDLLRCEEDNLHLIDERLTALASKFEVEPRRLLSHVLVYHLRWN